MTVLLALEGFSLASASNGREAFDMLRRGPAPCLVLLDLMMPGSDGWDFRRRQMEHPDLARIPTVLFSAHEGIAQKAKELGIAEFLTKPADFDALTAMVERQCPSSAAAPPEAPEVTP